MPPIRLFSITALALVAFAANSLLNRAALAGDYIDPASFTVIRLGSGALLLAALIGVSGGAPLMRLKAGSVASALALLAYAAFFSFAYLSLEAGMGALILFGVVQFTMIGWSLAMGERPRPLRWLGIAIAIAGFVWLVSPGVAAPDPLGAALMAAAGFAWGIYSLRGKGVADAVAATAANFLIAAPLSLPLLAFVAAGAPMAWQGVALAVVSGAITSGLGYALWYTALPHLDRSVAATAQLSPSALAAAASVALLGEPATLRLLLAGLMILGGVALTIRGGAYATASTGR